MFKPTGPARAQRAALLLAAKTRFGFSPGVGFRSEPAHGFGFEVPPSNSAALATSIVSSPIGIA